MRPAYREVWEEYPMAHPREPLLALLLGYGLVKIKGKWDGWGVLGRIGQGMGTRGHFYAVPPEGAGEPSTCLTIC